MLLHLDNLLRDHLLRHVPALNSDPQQVRFQPPDTDLLTEVRAINEMVVSLYLVELREDRRLRSNERETVRRNGDVFSTRVPDRLECHYLMSAWSPAVTTHAVEPALDEHTLLYAACAVLFQSTPLRPSRVYPPGAPELAFWGRFANEDLPTRVAPPEGFPGLGDFWGAMGQDARWRPSVQVVVTIPIELNEELSGPAVTTRFADYRQWDAPHSPEVLVQIGGVVVNAGAPGGPSPLANVVVSLEDPATNEVLAWRRTNALGRFDFVRLREARYRLRTQGVGLPPLTRDIDVPAPSGEYDMRYP